MTRRLASIIVGVDPHMYEVLWVLLAAAGVNVLTGVIDADSERVRRICLSVLVLAIGIFLHLAGSHAKEVRERAVRRQIDARRGTLREHVDAAIGEPGYGDKALLSAQWLAIAVLSGVILVVLLSVGLL